MLYKRTIIKVKELDDKEKKKNKNEINECTKI